MSSRSPLASHPNATALLLLPACIGGLIFPIEFLAGVDGFLFYLRPLQIPLVFASGWLVYLAIGLAATCVIAVPTALVAVLLRRPASNWVHNVCAWVALSIALLSVAEAAILWISASGWGSLASSTLGRRRWLYPATFLGCALWMWRDPGVKAGLARVALVASGAAFFITAGSPLALLFLPSAQSPAWPGAATVSSKVAHPDIILISFDALAADHTSLHGYGRQTTPNIDALASQAVVFDRYYANSNFTTPSVNSMINGVRPWTHRALQLEAVVDSSIADKGLIARLKKAGYQTMAVATNDWAAPFHNRSERWLDASVTGRTHRVCSRFGDTLIAHDSYVRPVLGMLSAARFCEIADKAMVVTRIWPKANHYDPEEVFDAARALIERRDPEKPTFLWIHLFPPHEPYATPEPFVGRFDPSDKRRSRFDAGPDAYFRASLDPGFPEEYIGRYDENIAYADYYLGTFLDWLKQRSIFGKAMIIVTADHGENFSHGYGSHGGIALYEDLVNVPLVIKLPDELSGTRSSVVAEQIDLMPTVLDLADIPVRDAVEGRSLRPAISGQEMSGAVYSMNFELSRRFGQLHTGSVAMIDGPWKYVRYLGTVKYPNTPELKDSLFDLSRDAAEQRDLVSEEPETANRMRAEIDMQLRRYGGPME